MNEPQKLRYLAAMGIHSYVSRRQLPGAAVTRRLAVVKPVPLPTETQRSPVTSVVAPPMPEIAVPGQRARAARLSSEPVPAAHARRPAVDESLRFSIAAMFAGGVAWVETLEERPLAREQVALVHAMAKAVHGKADTPRVAQFDWPMHNNHQLDQGMEAARAALAAFLHRHIEEQHCRALVLLGAGGRTFVDDGALQGIATVTTISTVEMLQNPARKRQAWADLQAVVLRP